MSEQYRLLQWQPFEDDYGVVGWWWECDVCEHKHNWVVPYIDTYTCDKCEAEHVSNFEE